MSRNFIQRNTDKKVKDLELDNLQLCLFSVVLKQGIPL